MMSPRTIAFGLLSAFERRWFRFRAFGRGSIIKPFPGRISGRSAICIGDDCFFGDGLVMIAVLEHAGRRHSPSLRIGDRCAFGSGLFVSCSTSVTIGDDVLASARVFIGDSYHGYEDTAKPVIRQPMAGEAPVTIGAGSFLGIGCAVLPGVTLGRGCYVGANAVVTRSFPDFTVVAGVPARAIRRFDPARDCWVAVTR